MPNLLQNIIYDEPEELNFTDDARAFESREEDELAEMYLADSIQQLILN